MEVYLNTAQSFSVPTTVADHLLGIASHDQLKILLYVLAHSDKTLSDTEIAKACKVRCESVEEALVFWQNVNVLQTELPVPSCQTAQETAEKPAEPTPITQPIAPPPVPVQNPVLDEARVAGTANIQTTSSGFHLLPTEIVERKNADPAMSAMLTAAEQRVGHPLIHTELRSIFWMHEYLGLGLDLIYMIIAYLVKNLCYNVRETESIAVKWHEAGIQTHEAAVADIERRSLSRSYTGRIMRIFEMSRRPTPKQQAYIDGWQKVGISPELVEYAYQISRDKNNDKLDFRYINGILKKWYEAKIHTVAEAESADAAYYESKRKQQTEQAGVQNPANPQKSARKGTYNPQEHSYDLTEIENLMKKI